MRRTTRKRHESFDGGRQNSGAKSHIRSNNLQWVVVISLLRLTGAMTSGIDSSGREFVDTESYDHNDGCRWMIDLEHRLAHYLMTKGAPE